MKGTAKVIELTWSLTYSPDGVYSSYNKVLTTEVHHASNNGVDPNSELAKKFKFYEQVENQPSVHIKLGRSSGTMSLITPLSIEFMAKILANLPKLNYLCMTNISIEGLTSLTAAMTILATSTTLRTLDISDNDLRKTSVEVAKEIVKSFYLKKVIMSCLPSDKSTIETIFYERNKEVDSGSKALAAILNIVPMDVVGIIGEYSFGSHIELELHTDLFAVT